MKPENWDTLSSKEKREVATDLLHSMRGNLIISQALVFAISAMKKVPKERREVSNIQDMELLMEELFPMYAMVSLAQAAHKSKSEEK